MRPFAALYEALTGCVERDSERLRHALAAAPAERLYMHAVRHKCAGVLFNALAEHRIRDGNILPLASRLRQYAAACALDSAEARTQVQLVVRAFKEAGIEHALIKSAASLYCGDKRVERSQISDLDIFIPSAQAERAVAVLHAQGYAYKQPALAGWYLREHHHLAPLVCESFKRSVELHVQLAPPGSFSMRSDWHALANDFETVDGPEGPTLRLDSFGRALHWAMHGAHLQRLLDAVNVAFEIRESAALLERLHAHTQEEQKQRVAVQSVICAAAQLANVQSPFDGQVQRFVQWAIHREDLPRALRDRMQLADAWYENGGRLRGPATPFAVSCRAKTAAGRIVASAIVMAGIPARML